MPVAHLQRATIAFERQGDGPTILLLPGLATGMAYYARLEPLLRENFGTLLVDPRGIGQSLSTDAEFTAETWADDFAELIDHLGIERVHVVGSSHGGSMALAMAHAHPEKVASLTIAGGFSELTSGIAINLRLRINIVSKLGMGPEIADHVTLWTNRPAFLDTPEGVAAADLNRQLIMKNDPVRYIAMVRSMQHWGRALPGQENEPRFTSRLAGIKAPTLALTGDSDHYVPSHLSRLIATRVQDAEYREIPECGHIAAQERPKETADIISTFVTRHL